MFLLKFLVFLFEFCFFFIKHSFQKANRTVILYKMKNIRYIDHKRHIKPEVELIIK